MARELEAWRFGGYSQTGLWSWLTTTEHNRIGILNLASSLGFFLLAALTAGLMRTQTSVPNNNVLGPETYNQAFTMHGTTMVFLVGMPVLVGFGNYLVPLMIGAEDMAFPRLNAFSYWLFLFGGLFLWSSFLFGVAPDAGWFAYAPLTSLTFSPGLNLDFWVLGIQLLGISSIAGALNFVVTILKLRAPGMTINRMPLFVWGMLVTAFIILVAIPSLTAAASLLMLDRYLGTPFYMADQGGDPLLWQHLFWAFGHPEVYILVLPAMGIISEVVPVFSRKPIFGYSVVAWSSVAIGFLGMIVWAHHMFAVGLPLVAQIIFSANSFLIAVPTSVKIFNWLATMWGGRIALKTPMLFALGFIGLFTIGGLSGISVATVPIDWQVTQSYYIVAHFHYTLFGGTVFGVFAGIYFWFPKMSGRLLSEKLGKWHFWLLFIGFNTTFLPLHIAGLMGMPRRIWTYAPGQGWEIPSFVSFVGYFFILAAVIVFLVNLSRSLRNGKPAGDDPWNAWTLEWATSSPPPAHNFDSLPPVRSRRPLWDLKHPERPDWRADH